jgi:hypothetical protein
MDRCREEGLPWAGPDCSVGPELYVKKPKEESPISQENLEIGTKRRKRRSLSSFGLVAGGATLVVGEKLFP